MVLRKNKSRSLLQIFSVDLNVVLSRAHAGGRGKTSFERLLTIFTQYLYRFIIYGSYLFCSFYFYLFCLFTSTVIYLFADKGGSVAAYVRVQYVCTLYTRSVQPVPPVSSVSVCLRMYTSVMYVCVCMCLCVFQIDSNKMYKHVSLARRSSNAPVIEKTFKYSEIH